MITQDRWGVALPADPSPDIDYTWSVRMAATNGVYTSTSEWTYYEVPPDAIMGRSRSAQLDGLTWACSLEILPEALPETTEPLAYYQLEVDLVDSVGRHWPYFTGPIDTIAESHVIQDGAIVETQRVEAHGTISRGKGMRINVLSINPTRTSYTAIMTGLARAVTVSMTSASNTIPGALHTVDIQVGTGSFPGVIVDDNADFSSPKVYGGANDYTILATDGQSPTINWITAAPATYYVKYWALSHFIVGRDWGGAGNAAFIRIPDGGVPYSGAESIPGRRIFDTFQTYAAAGCITTAITVRDPEPYKSARALVAVTGGPTEYLIWTKTDGTEEARAVTSTDGNGVITTAAFTAAPAAGDPIRLGTTEPVRSWEFWNRDTGSTASQALFYSDVGDVAEYSRNSFGVEPRSGMLIPLVGRHYASASSGVWAGNGASALFVTLDTLSAIGSDNRVESTYYKLLTNTGLALIPTTDFVTAGLSGGYIKSLSQYDTDLDAMLEDLGRNALPPNGFCHDLPDGRIRVDGFTQASVPNFVLGRIGGIEISSLPQPVTAVAIVSKGAERNIAAQCRPEWTAASWTNPEYMFDGNKATGRAATFSGAGITSDTIRLYVTPPTIQALPHLTGLRFHGTAGVVSVKAVMIHNTTRAISSSRMVEGFGYLVLSPNTDSLIPGERLCEALAAAYADSTPPAAALWALEITFYRDNTAGGTTAPSISEIEVLSDVEAAWTSFTTDDTSGSPPAAWSTANDEGFGEVWWQRDMTQSRSYRYMTPAKAKRILPVWALGYASQKHRLEKLTVEQITQDECRDYAERYVDEYVRQSREYRVRAALDPRIDLGDTAAVVLPDGTGRELFVWAIADGGARDDFEAQYSLMDYSA